MTWWRRALSDDTFVAEVAGRLMTERGLHGDLRGHLAGVYVREARKWWRVEVESLPSREREVVVALLLGWEGSLQDLLDAAHELS